ncbi:hypothetical protein LINPERPRIM_LOCUS31814 [Linum perenne]
MVNTSFKSAFFVVLLVFVCTCGSGQCVCQEDQPDSLICDLFCPKDHCHCNIKGFCICDGVQHSLVAGHLVPTHDLHN